MGGFRFTGPNYVFVGIPQKICKCSGYQQPIDSTLESWMLQHSRLDVSVLPEEMRSDFLRLSHMSGTEIKYKGYRKVMRAPTRYERSFMDAENQVADLEPIELPYSTQTGPG